MNKFKIGDAVVFKNGARVMVIVDLYPATNKLEVMGIDHRMEFIDADQFELLHFLPEWICNWHKNNDCYFCTKGEGNNEDLGHPENPCTDSGEAPEDYDC